MQKPVIVEKSGSEISTTANGMNMDYVDERCDEIARLEEFSFVVVSSGAVRCGEAYWKNYLGKDDIDALQLVERDGYIDPDQLYATMGSEEVVNAYKSSLSRDKIPASQILATHHEIEDKDEGGRLRNALLGSLALGIVPIANENDAMSIKELKRL